MIEIPNKALKTFLHSAMKEQIHKGALLDIQTDVTVFAIGWAKHLLDNEIEQAEDSIERIIRRLAAMKQITEAFKDNAKKQKKKETSEKEESKEDEEEEDSCKCFFCSPRQTEDKKDKKKD